MLGKCKHAKVSFDSNTTGSCLLSFSMCAVLIVQAKDIYSSWFVV
jgi:hypothetical protein